MKIENIIKEIIDISGILLHQYLSSMVEILFTTHIKSTSEISLLIFLCLDFISLPERKIEKSHWASKDSGFDKKKFDFNRNFIKKYNEEYKNENLDYDNENFAGSTMRFYILCYINLIFQKYYETNKNLIKFLKNFYKSRCICKKEIIKTTSPIKWKATIWWQQL